MHTVSINLRVFASILGKPCMSYSLFKDIVLPFSSNRTEQRVDPHPDLADGLVSRLHTDVEALLAVPVIRLGKDVVDVVEDVALVEELMVRLLELQTPAPTAEPVRVLT